MVGVGLVEDAYTPVASMPLALNYHYKHKSQKEALQEVWEEEENIFRQGELTVRILEKKMALRSEEISRAYASHRTSDAIIRCYPADTIVRDSISI